MEQVRAVLEERGLEFERREGGTEGAEDRILEREAIGTERGCIKGKEGRIGEAGDRDQEEETIGLWRKSGQNLKEGRAGLMELAMSWEVRMYSR